MHSIWFWLVFLGYSLAIVAPSFRATGKENTAEAFWRSGRVIPWWWLAISISAGWLMLGWIGFGMGQIYMFGCTGLWVLPLPWLILLIVIVVAVPLYRRIPFYSIPAAMGERFGAPARILIACLSLVVFLSWTGAELVMVKTLVGTSLGLEPRHGWIVLLAFLAPVIVYTWRGGFRAVVFTDVVQFSLMAVFMLCLLGFAWLEARIAVAGQPMLEFLAHTQPPGLAAGQKALGLWNLGPLFPLVLLIGYLPGWAIEQDLWLRLQVAHTTRAARRIAWLVLGLVGIFVIVIPAVVAGLALAIFPPTGGVEAQAVGGAGSMAIRIIPALITRMPTWLAPLMFLGILACQMSTVDTFANAAALALGHDLLGEHGQRNCRPCRMVSVAVLLSALVYAVFMDRLGDIYYISSGVLSASIAVPLLAWGWRRVTAGPVLAASAIGALSAIGFYWFEYKVWALKPPGAVSWLAPSSGYNYLAGCVLMAAGVLVVSTLLWPQSRHESIRAKHASEPDKVPEVV